MKKETFESKLKSYIALTSSLLAIQQTNANAQIIYRDVIPDKFIENSFFNLDLNNDGIVDFRLNQEHHASHDSGAYWGWARKLWSYEIEALAENKIVASQNDPLNPAQLNSGDVVSINNSFIQSGFLSYFFLSSAYYPGGWSFDIQSSHGEWDTDSVSFLGLRFKVGNNIYYGWARIEIVLSKTILYDYAYNAFPNQPILAGQGMVNSVSEILNENSVSIYPNPTTDNLTIQLHAPVTNGSITLTNTLGQVVYTVVINQKSKIINLKSLPSGIYFVQVVTDKGVIVKNVIKQ